MVKVRRNSRRPVTRKAPKHIALRVANSINDKEIKLKYDKKKTPGQNLRDLGLMANPNKEIGATKPIDKSFPGFMGYTDMISHLKFKRKPRKITMDMFDIDFAEKNIAKHGENYEAMQKDIKTNNRQYTAKQMEKFLEKYKAFKEQEKDAEENSENNNEMDDESQDEEMDDDDEEQEEQQDKKPKSKK